MSGLAAPPPWNLLSISASGGTGFHLYLVDATGRKIGVAWGKADEKIATAQLWASAPRFEAALARLVEKHIKRGPFDEPLGESEQEPEINEAVAALREARDAA